MWCYSAYVFFFPSTAHGTNADKIKIDKLFKILAQSSTRTFQKGNQKLWSFRQIRIPFLEEPAMQGPSNGCIIFHTFSFGMKLNSTPQQFQPPGIAIPSILLPSPKLPTNSSDTLSELLAKHGNGLVMW